MSTPEVNGHKEGKWIEEILRSMTDDLRTANWAESVLTRYSSLPKRTIAQEKQVKNLIRTTAGQLVQNPQDISTAAFIWERQNLFRTLVKEDSKTLIRERWEDITPEQLASLVRTYANDPQAQDFAKEMLTSYFDRPKTRRERIDVYYKFVSSLLDLVGDDRAPKEGVRIAYHDTDILPKYPHLIEQTMFFGLPYSIFIVPKPKPKPKIKNSLLNLSKDTEKEEDLFSFPRDKDKEEDFQKLLIAKYVLAKLVSVGFKDLKELHKKEEDFIYSPEVTILWKKEQVEVMGKIGEDMLKQLNNTLYLFFSNNDTDSAEENKGNNWVRSLLDDPTDPLSIKFQKVFPQMAVWK